MPLLTENDQLRSALDAARKGINDFLAGDYPNPRNHECEHGRQRWEDCTTCDEVHFLNLLKRLAILEPELPSRKTTDS